MEPPPQRPVPRIPLPQRTPMPQPQNAQQQNQNQNQNQSQQRQVQSGTSYVSSSSSASSASSSIPSGNSIADVLLMARSDAHSLFWCVLRSERDRVDTFTIAQLTEARKKIKEFKHRAEAYSYRRAGPAAKVEIPSSN